MNKDVSDRQLLATLKRLERLADLTDSRFRIPFTKIRFGIDAIIGLIPFVGDSISLIMSLYLLFEASKLGAPFSLKIKMLGNVIFDFVIGLIPIFGDAVDVFFKANNRNMKLLVEHITQDYQSRQVISQPEKENKVPRLILILTIVLLAVLAIYALTMFSGIQV
tara:strand:+ start:5270 stop:5761 length:492 start_codon:yes stop_codon:yes gene_type:complete